MSAVLGLLQRCDETLDEAIDDAVVGREELPWGEVAKLETPLPWITILERAADLEEPSCSLKIVESIGPLVECMCDDMTRQFFKSNQHWNESIYPFARLIYNLFRTSIRQYSYDESETEDNMKVIDTLLKHNCLVRCFIQWGFWDSSNRPDIAKELTAEVCESIVEIGVMSASLLIAITAKSRGRKQVKTIGSMSFINKEYDPNCMVSYVEALISQMNSQGESLGEGAGFTKLQYLIAESDCVDKGVIAEIIRYGTNITSDLVSAEQLTRLSYPMILQSSNVEKDLPCDTRAAFAIRAGLIEMCLNFICHLGDNVDDCTLSLLDNVEKTFKTVHAVQEEQYRGEVSSPRTGCRHYKQEVIRYGQIDS